MADAEAFSSQQELKDFLDLLMRHWNVVADTLQSGDVYLPLLLEDDHGIAHANDWAQGFMRGIDLRREDWAELLDDEDHGAGSYRSWHWRMSTTPIRPCDLIRSPWMRIGASNSSRVPRPGSRRSIAILSHSAGCSQTLGVDKPPTAAPSPKSGAMIRVPAGPGRNTSGAAANPHCTDEDRHVLPIGTDEPGSLFWSRNTRCLSVSRTISGRIAPNWMT